MGDITVPLGMMSYQRRNADEPDIRFINRYLEKDPTDQVDGVAAIRRPGLVQRIQAGDGPIRRTYWQSGFCDGDLFIFSKNQLLRLHNTPTEGDDLLLLDGFVYGTGTPSVDATRDYLFFADGVLLQYTDGTGPCLQIVTPDEVVISSICVLKGFVFCSVQDSDLIYWIEPGEVVIDPFNFITAESQPDIVRQLMAVGDQFWAFGEKTTEPWYLTGVDEAPVAPVQGRPFDRGVWGGTAVKVDEEVILVGSDARVYSVTSGAQPISDPGIEERIARAMKIQVLDL